MRKLAQTSTALLLGSATAALAAGPDSIGAQASLNVRVDLDNQFKSVSGLHYAAAVDYDRRYLQIPGNATAARVEFDRKGFLTAWLNGLPFAHRVELQEGEGGGGLSSYNVVDWSLVTIGALGIGYGIYEVVDQKDTRDPKATRSAAPPPSGVPVPSGVPTPTPFAGAFYKLDERSAIPAYQQWLDSGTGGMGDLVVIKE